MASAANPSAIGVKAAMVAQLKANLAGEAYHLRGRLSPTVYGRKAETNHGTSSSGAPQLYVWWSGQLPTERTRLATAGARGSVLVGISYRGFVWAAGISGEVEDALALLDHDTRHAIAVDPGLGCEGCLARWVDSRPIYEPGQSWGEINGRFEVLAGETWEA